MFSYVSIFEYFFFHNRITSFTEKNDESISTFTIAAAYVSIEPFDMSDFSFLSFYLGSRTTLKSLQFDHIIYQRYSIPAIVCLSS